MAWASFFQLLICGIAAAFVVGYLYERIIRATAATTDATREIWAGQHAHADKLIAAYEKLNNSREETAKRMSQDSHDATRAITAAMNGIVDKNNAILSAIQEQASAATARAAKDQREQTRELTQLVASAVAGKTIEAPPAKPNDPKDQNGSHEATTRIDPHRTRPPQTVR